MNENGRAGFLNNGRPSNPSHDPETKIEDDNSVPLILSDILQPNLGRPKTPLSHQRPQISTMGTPTQKASSSASTPLFPSSSRIAVHIKSTASPSSYSQHKDPATLERGRERRRKQESALTGTGSPARTPFSRDGGDPSLQPKKRGRPKGWKPGKGMTYAEARGDSPTVKPKKPAEQPKEAKRRGRPPRPLGLAARELYLRQEPEYFPFKCEWEESPEKPCPAELQNIKTLRKHVYYIHGDIDPLVCRWAKCAAKEPALEFATDMEFEEHMEKEHFRPFVWHVGEGYQNDGISTLKRDAAHLPAYLFDKDGNQVTPSVTEQQLEDDQHHKERRRKLKRLLLLKDENAPSEEEYTRQTLGLT
ncbi:hypothetical protein F5B20DRAFT_525270 [Whalleya microplaca]|nr:hypothetical protein F5B20DRAFT_525270 [Whalleya microplaca]